MFCVMYCPSAAMKAQQLSMPKHMDWAAPLASGQVCVPTGVGPVGALVGCLVGPLVPAFVGTEHESKHKSCVMYCPSAAMNVQQLLMPVQVAGEAEPSTHVKPPIGVGCFVGVGVGTETGVGVGTETGGGVGCLVGSLVGLSVGTFCKEDSK